jgi:hypothetical protein
MHGAGKRRQRDAELRDSTSVLERHKAEHVFPIPAAE